MKKIQFDLSIVVCAKDMQRELPRTILSLSARYQRDASSLTWELIVLDNGSSPALQVEDIADLHPHVTIFRPEYIFASPAKAINAALKSANGRFIGLWIDGARIASPGIIAFAFEALANDSDKVVGTLAFHLGPDVQMRSVLEGYGALQEDHLLASIPWRTDGYKLFEISVLAGSSSQGWFGCIAETNGMFAHADFWQRLGGLDERFQGPGGGYVNLDLWNRAVGLSGYRPWILLGEASFHQVHGGAATNGTQRDRNAMRDEYETIMQSPHDTPTYTPRYIGSLTETSFRQGIPLKSDRHRNVHTIGGRPFRSSLSQHTLQTVQAATLKTRYKGLRFAKNPFDIALYLHNLQKIKPASIIEIGTSEGGAAVWFRDQCDVLNLKKTKVVSIDISPPSLQVDGVELFQGDANIPQESFPSERLCELPHPWLVIEDSAHTFESVDAVLAYFHPLVTVGDMIVVEDGVVADLPEDLYRRWKDGPNRAVAKFLQQHAESYEIDEESCDFYGKNVTWAPNGWLKRVRR